MTLHFRPSSLHPLLFAYLGLTLSVGCAPSPPPGPTSPPPQTPPPAGPEPPEAPPERQTPADEVPLSSGTRILADVGFDTPESVLHDQEQDVYLVSNIGGDPLAKDGNGFISRVSPDGQVEARFIEGGRAGVTLDAPKGMALVDDTLVVADIDVLRLFNRRTGAPQGTLAVRGATFLNGVAAGPDRRTIYVSDSGLTTGFKPSGTDAVYRIVDGKISKLAQGTDLGQPNGLLPDKGGTWVVTWGSGELYWLSNAGKRERVEKLPKGSLDGIVRTPDGLLLISSWEGSAVFGRQSGKTFRPIVSGVSSPADIGYDKKRRQLLVPLFEKNALVIHALDEAHDSPP
jgi:sugar lactone lactonase YvrE